jgi:DNA-3-methyladenine glycosylase
VPDRRLSRKFYERETLLVARELIGMHLVRIRNGKRIVGRIVETEAYKGPEDLAAHSARGRTERNQVMFGPAGYAYVYMIYGFWFCLNAVTEKTGVPHAVLIRGLEPVEGLAEKAWGPGLLCRALDIDRGLNGADLRGEALFIEHPENFRPARIAVAARIGVDYAGKWAKKPWRFFDADSPHVSTVTAAARRKAGLTVPPAAAAGRSRSRKRS